MNSIKLVIMDIDGCILPKNGKPVDLSIIERIRQQNHLSRDGLIIPGVTLCSGRPSSYVELLHRLIESEFPAIFEWGAGVYIPEDYRFHYTELCTPLMKDARRKIMDTLETKVFQKYDITIQPGKEITITIYHSLNITSEDIYNELKNELITTNVLDNYEACLYNSHIDLIPKGIDKGLGLQYLLGMTGLSADQVAGVGDENSDISFLELSKFSACPKGSSPSVQEMVDYVSPYENGLGIIDILNKINNDL